MLVSVFFKRNVEKYENIFVFEKFEKDSYVAITDVIPSARYKRKIIIPAEIDGLPVKRIGAFAFTGVYSKQIILPNSINSIDEFAFAGENRLVSITIPDSVEQIKDDTFIDCNSLKEIRLPDSLTSIGEKAFYACTSLKTINLPNALTSIGESAFSNCHSLKSIIIPDSVGYIGKDAFWGCNNLQDVFLPESWKIHTTIKELIEKLSDLGIGLSTKLIIH